MTARGEALAASGRVPLVYVSGIEIYGRRLGQDIRRRAGLERLLSPVRCLTYRAVWPTVARPGSLGALADWPDGLPAMLDRVDGMIVVLHPAGWVNRACADEIAAARRASLPILVRSAGPLLTPLVDCRLTLTDRGMRIEIPAAPRGGRDSLRAAMFAIGATQVTR